MLTSNQISKNCNVANFFFTYILSSRLSDFEQGPFAIICLARLGPSLITFRLMGTQLSGVLFYVRFILIFTPGWPTGLDYECRLIIPNLDAEMKLKWDHPAGGLLQLEKKKTQNHSSTWLRFTMRIKREAVCYLHAGNSYCVPFCCRPPDGIRWKAVGPMIDRAERQRSTSTIQGALRFITIPNSCYKVEVVR